MKLLLLLEHTFIEDKNGNILSDGVVDYNYLKRYLSIFEEVNVCARINKEPSDKDLNSYKLMVSGKNVTFTYLPWAISSKELLLNFFKFKKIFRNAVEEYDKVIIRAPSLISLFLYNEISSDKKWGIEFVMGANCILSEKNWLRKIVNKYLDKRAKKMCLKANGVAYVTEKMLQSKYPSYSLKYKKNHNYFDTHYSSIDLLPDDFFEKKQNTIPKRKKIIHVGSMQNERKGQKILIDITKKIIDDGYDIETIFIGDGIKKGDLINYTNEINIANKVKFLGNISNRSKVMQELRKADIFVLPSSSEGLPRSIIEAMANSLPCVASNVDGIPELLDDEYLSEYDDVNRFVQIIERFLNDDDLIRSVGRKNYLKAKKYSYDVVSKRRKEFYKKIKEL